MPLQRLPVWIQISCFFLALNAGMINVIGLLNIAHQSVSHMTGNVSMVVVESIQNDWFQVLFMLGVVFCFTLGSFYSGFIIRDSKLRFGRRYGSVLSIETFFLLLAWLLIDHFPHYALLWAAAAMGLQNALASTYNGTIIRTTHLSGVLTDIGLNIGYRFRGLYVDPRKFTLLVLILIGFFVGGVIGAIAQYFFHQHAFLFPAILTTILSLTYWLYYWKTMQQIQP
jgi:uncharacterized membrane protein YoaK (UPF0700 family)